MEYKCEVYDQNSQPVISIRTHTPVEKLPEVLGEAYGLLMQHLAEAGEHPGGAPFTAYYNMDMQDLDIEIGFPVEHQIPGKAAIQASEMPAGKYASCMHKGSYETLPPAYEALYKFIKDNGLQPSGIVYEFYLNNRDEVPQEELKTQIVFPLEA